jgi:hypothetical protein
VSPDGSNAKFIVSRLTLAAEQCTNHPYNYPWRLCVRAMVRAFQSCTVMSANHKIRWRTLNAPQAGANNNGTQAESFEILDEITDQNDQVDKVIDWHSRWKSVQLTAESLVTRIAMVVTQDIDISEDLFPVYAKGFIPTDPSGLIPGYSPGPTLAASMSAGRQYTQENRGRPRVRQENTPRAPSRPDRSRTPARTRTQKDEVYTTAPPSKDQSLAWYKSRTPQCTACGSQVHTRWSECPSRNKHFPDWTPSGRPQPQYNQVEAEVNAVNASDILDKDLPPPPSKAPYIVTGNKRSEQKPDNLGSRYAHRDEGNRGRAKERGARNRSRTRSGDRSDRRGSSRDTLGDKQVSFSRSPSRERSRSRGPSQEPKDFRPSSGNA